MRAIASRWTSPTSPARRTCRRRISAGSSRATFGEPPHRYLLTRRMERAADLLRNTDRSVADICLTVGLRSVGSFTTSFGKAYGMSPTAYRGVAPAGPGADPRLPAAGVRPSQRSTFGEDGALTRG